MRRKDHGMKDTNVRLYYPFTTSSRWACFNCRVCFHSWTGKIHGCVQCGKEMLYTGTHFRAPKKSNVREWKKLEMLVKNGTRFTHEGGNGHIKPLTVRATKKILSVAREAPYHPVSKVGTKNFAMRKPGKGKRILRNASSSSYQNSESYLLPC